jgi:formamidopyrimidine-DNA glycosylase
MYIVLAKWITNMIELPEAVVLSKQVTETLAGKHIVRVEANHTPHKFAWFSGDPGNYQALLGGKAIQQALYFGNHVEIHADGMLLVISTPMRYHAVGEQPPEKHQLLLAFDDNTSVSCTVRMWGGLFCFPEGEAGGMPDYLIAKEKPSVLSEAFDHAWFDDLREQGGAKLSAKEFLATQQRIPGLGNGVLHDILWTARVHPKRKLGDLPETEFNELFKAVKGVLADMVEQGGRDTERDLFGQPGGYRTILSKNTLDQPCPACGGPIHKEAYLGGAIYYCPTCQNLS